MHPVHNINRRLARAKNLINTMEKGGATACFVDSAQFERGDAFAAVVVDHKGHTVSGAALYTRKAEVAEQVAIALAIADARFNEIYSDSKSAIRAFSRGRIAPQAARVIK